MTEPPGARLSAEALALESWRQADEALAQAVVELARALPAARAVAKPRTREVPPRALEALSAIEAAQAALQAAMRRRGLESFGKIGESAAFDPRAHALERGRAHPGEAVRVTAPGVRRLGGETLIKAAARPIRARAPA